MKMLNVIDRVSVPLSISLDYSDHEGEVFLSGIGALNLNRWKH